MPKLFICSNATNELLPETNGSTMVAGGKGQGTMSTRVGQKNAYGGEVKIC